MKRGRCKPRLKNSDGLMGLVSKHFEQVEIDLHIHLAMLSTECTAHGFVPEEFCFREYSEFITSVYWT